MAVEEGGDCAVNLSAHHGAHASDTAHMVATVQLGWRRIYQAHVPVYRIGQHSMFFTMLGWKVRHVRSLFRGSAMECGEGRLVNRSEMETNVRHDPQPAAQFVTPRCAMAYAAHRAVPTQSSSGGKGEDRHW